MIARLVWIESLDEAERDIWQSRGDEDAPDGDGHGTKSPRRAPRAAPPSIRLDWIAAVNRPACRAPNDAVRLGRRPFARESAPIETDRLAVINLDSKTKNGPAGAARFGGAIRRNRLDHGPCDPRERIERHPRRPARFRGAGRHQARIDPRRNEAQLSRLRDERDREPGASGRARRSQASPPSHPLRDARAQFHSRPPLQQVVAHGRRHHGQVPPAWGPRDLRRARSHGAGLLHARPPHRRAGQFRLGRRRSACGVPLHGSEARPRRARAPRGPRQGHRRFQAELRREGAGAGRLCRRDSPTFWSTGLGASPSAWRRTFRPTTSARRSTRCSR